MLLASDNDASSICLMTFLSSLFLFHCLLNYSCVYATGIKVGAVYSICGIRLVGSVVGGMTGDLNNREWFNYLLERTTRQVH